LFAVYACGYRPRCALEVSDSTQNRLSKIEDIILQCRFGIHDISFVAIDLKTKLPRFNMPFELGVFFGAKRFGSRQQKLKIALILDERAHRYRASLSDISGQDVAIHRGMAKVAICHVRDWLDSCGKNRAALPGGDFISDQYSKFSRELPRASRNKKLNVRKLTYADTCRAIESWLKDNV
jgi:hypothetical protein